LTHPPGDARPGRRDPTTVRVVASTERKADANVRSANTWVFR
jgi:hypothetical protein